MTRAEPRLGVRAGSLFGIEVRVHWSLLLIFALVMTNLGAGVFPVWHPEWSPAAVWAMSAGAAILLFVSVLAHELSHSLVARRFGIEVPRITLFMVGGVSHMEEDPPSPTAEFAVAIVGPLTSLAIGVGSLAAALPAIGAAGIGMSAFRNADPLTSLLLWLGPVNIVLGLFNLAPGFPLDGGRVFRSLAWWTTGDLLRATRWASNAGTVMAWGLMALGLLSVLGGMVVQGIWFLLIGAFLLQAAGFAYRHQLVRSSLGDVPVSQIMKTDLASVSPATTVEAFISENAQARDQLAYPVVDDGGWLGIVRIDALESVPPDERPDTTLRSVMRKREDLTAVEPDAPAAEVFQRLPAQSGEFLPVVEDGRFLGLLEPKDILKWMSLHGAPGPGR